MKPLDRNPEAAAVYLILFLIAVQIAGWLLLLKIPFYVDGRLHFARYGETLESALKRSGYKLNHTVYLEMDRGLSQSKPEKVRFFENGVEVSVAKRIYGIHRLYSSKRNVRFSRRETHFFAEDLKPQVVGKGPFLKLEKYGYPSVLVSETIPEINSRFRYHFKAGSPAVFKKTDGIKEKAVALTFDDGPSVYTPLVLSVLRKYGVKATFFVIGKHVEKHPHYLKQIAKEGHLIGNHSYSHRNMKKLKPHEIEIEIKRTEELIKTHTGVRCFWFRPPMGQYDKKLISHLRNRGYSVSLWTVDTQDWKYQNFKRIFNICNEQLKPGDVILLHDGGGYRKETAIATELIIRAALKRGFVFVTLADFSRIKSQ